jgi:hypothetical protein
VQIPFECFKGHIGGDDFFAGIRLKERDFYSALDNIKHIVTTFSQEVLSLYDNTDRERGYIIAKDRSGKESSFDLLSVSAVIVHVGKQSKNRSVDFIHKHFASQKKAAKLASDHINISSLL